VTATSYVSLGTLPAGITCEMLEGTEGGVDRNRSKSGSQVERSSPPISQGDSNPYITGDLLASDLLMEPAAIGL
jgi:hypothetical protein